MDLKRTRLRIPSPETLLDATSMACLGQVKSVDDRNMEDVYQLMEKVCRSYPDDQNIDRWCEHLEQGGGPSSWALQGWTVVDDVSHMVFMTKVERQPMRFQIDDSIVVHAREYMYATAERNATMNYPACRLFNCGSEAYAIKLIAHAASGVIDTDAEYEMAQAFMGARDFIVDEAIDETYGAITHLLEDTRI